MSGGCEGLRQRKNGDVGKDDGCCCCMLCQDFGAVDASGALLLHALVLSMICSRSTLRLPLNNTACRCSACATPTGAASKHQRTGRATCGTCGRPLQCGHPWHQMLCGSARSSKTAAARRPRASRSSCGGCWWTEGASGAAGICCATAAQQLCEWRIWLGRALLRLCAYASGLHQQPVRHCIQLPAWQRQACAWISTPAWFVWCRARLCW